MVTLSEQDVLELLGYPAERRHPLEILGFGASTQGAEAFRAQRPDYVPEVSGIITKAVERDGRFPSEPLCPFIRKIDESSYVVHYYVEKSMGQIEETSTRVPSVEHATVLLLRETANPDYLPMRFRLTS